jgi:hexosaminidase
MAFPREAALAEVLWTPPARRDFADFTARLTTHLDRLRALDVNFRPPEGPLVHP